LKKFFNKNFEFRKLMSVDSMKHSVHYVRLIKEKAVEILEQQTVYGKVIEVAEEIEVGIGQSKAKESGGSIKSFFADEIANLIKTSVKVEQCIEAFQQNFNSNIDKIYKADKVESIQTTVEANTDEIVKELSDEVADKISIIISNEFIAPNINMLGDAITGKITSSVDDKITTEFDTILANRRIKISHDRDPHNLLPDIYKNIGSHPDAIKATNKIINDTEIGGELGLPHLGAIQKLVDRQIEVLDSNGRHKFYVGKAKHNEEPIKIQYHKDKASRPGHWTLEDGKEAPRPSSSSSENDCLIYVIASQTHVDPESMRKKIVQEMKDNFETIANSAFDYMRLEVFMKNALVLGGAIYTASTAEGAEKYLTGPKKVFGSKADSHPDTHIGDENIITASKERPKSGFLNIKDASLALHSILSNHRDDVMKMNKNSAEGTEPFKKLEIKVNATEDLQNIQMIKAKKGKLIENQEPIFAKSYVVVLRHEKDHQDDFKKDVVVHTFFPKDTAIEKEEVVFS
jgi:hypothetical protein